jgi:glutamyl/glutaminyl-tRNA synthetase
LLTIQNPAELEDWLGDLNPHSKEVIKDAYAVPSLATAVLGDKFQFERLGNFRARELPVVHAIRWVFTTQLIVLL